ncbi:MAG TPA: MFS transporter, partial [Opitutaceae bacterium]|nr:MFS transporter [Opitutaceae bacterium]
MPPPRPAPDRLPLREKLCYGFGDLASCLYWQTFMMYLIYYYTDVFGISALAAAVLLGPSRFIDAFFDPLVGLVADRTETRWGKYRPFLLWVCVPFAAVGVLAFTTPGAATARHLDAALGGGVRFALGLLARGGGGLAHLGRSLHWSWLAGASGGLASGADALRHEVAGRLVWALLTYNGLMLLYTTINIPYTAMLGVMSPDPRERTSLSSIKFVGAYLGGNILISFGLLKLVQVLGGADAAAGWQRAFLVIGAVAIACFVITFANTRERVRPPQAQRTSVGRDLRDLVTNGPWLVLLAATLAFILFVAARSS